MERAPTEGMIERDVGAEAVLVPVPELNVDRRRQESRQERFQRTKYEIASRLAITCADMPEPEFDELVTHMAELQIKYALRRSADLFPEVLEWERGAVDVT